MKSNPLRDEFQGLCLLSSAGHRWMCSHYDHFPIEVRKFLQDCPYNLCPACIDKQAHHMRKPDSLIRAAQDMIDEVRRQEQQDAA